jgi:hypothetical protein
MKAEAMVKVANSEYFLKMRGTELPHALGRG